MIAIQGLSFLIGLVSLVCYIMVVVKMFQNGDTGLGVACAVGFIVCGLGVLVAFIMGWVKSSAYDVKNIMLVWTGCIVANIVLNIIGVAMQASA